MEKIYLDATLRNEVGKESVKKLRDIDIVPAVVYKKGEKTINLKLSRRDLLKVLRTSGGENVIINLRVPDDGKFKEKTVIIKEIQHHPLRGDILHVDFNQISLTQTLTVNVPIESYGESVGVKEGGILEHIMREVEVRCLPTEIPDKIKIDVSHLNIGDSVFVKDIIAPQGVKILNDAEAIVLSVKPPVIEKVEEKVVEEVAEPEVIREKKEKTAEGAEEEEPGAKKKEE